jgi:hypothetical protein
VALDLRYDATTAISHADPGGLIPTACTLTLKAASGAAIQTLTQAAGVTLPTFTTTLSTGSTRAALILGSVSGIVVGDLYKLISQGVTYLVRPASVSGSTVSLASSLPMDPAVGSTLCALKMTATIAAPGVANIQANCRLEWSFSDASSVPGYHAVTAHVVRWRWDPPVTASDIRDLIAKARPSDKPSEIYLESIAARVDTRIRQSVEGTGKRPFLYGDPQVFREAGLVVARLLLADDGLLPVGSQPELYMKELSFRLNAELQPALSSLQVYDADGDGQVSAVEARGKWFSFRVTR